MKCMKALEYQHGRATTYCMRPLHHEKFENDKGCDKVDERGSVLPEEKDDVR